MPVHMRYNVQSHTISDERASVSHGREGSIRILQEGGSRFTGLFEKTVRLNDVPVKVGDHEETQRIKANRSSIIDYLQAENKLGERRFTFGPKGLFGIGLFGTGLSDQEIQSLFTDSVQEEKKAGPAPSRPKAVNRLPALPSGQGALMPPGIKGAPLLQNGTLLDQIKSNIPGSRVKQVFEESDHVANCFETCYSTPQSRGSMDVIVHVRVIDHQPSSAEWNAWYAQLEQKLAASHIQQIVVYPSAIEGYPIGSAWEDMQVAYRSLHGIRT